MQVPELYRQGVVRPLDDAAAAQLANWWVETSIRTEWLPVIDNDFDLIWEFGVLQRINEACGVRISDYEEVELPAAKVNVALNAISVTPLPESTEVAVFCQNLKAMMVQAIESQKPLFFVF